MQLVYGVIGGIIGYVATGFTPTGAYYGFVIGYSIGSVIESSNQKMTSEGPRLTDLKVTISSFGAFDPRVYVAGRISGNIVECSDLKPTSTTQTTEAGGTSGGPVSETKLTSYSVDMLVKLCVSNGTHDVARIWANNKLIYSRSPLADAATLLASAGVVGKIIVYDGRDDQLPDPTLEALYGVGNVPAYLGVLTVMFVDFQLADYSNNVAATQLTFEVLENPQETATFKPGVEVPAVYLNDVAFSRGSLYRYTLSDGTHAQAVVDNLDGNGPQVLAPFVTSNFPLMGAGVDANGACMFVPQQSFFPSGIAISDDPIAYFCAPAYDPAFCPPVATGYLADVFFYKPAGEYLASIHLGEDRATGREGIDTVSFLAAEDDGVFAFSATNRNAATGANRWKLFLTGGATYAESDQQAQRIIVADGIVYALLVSTTTTGQYSVRKIRALDGVLLGSWLGPIRATAADIAPMLYVFGGELVVVEATPRFKFNTTTGALTIIDLAVEGLPNASSGTSVAQRYRNVFYDESVAIYGGTERYTSGGGPQTFGEVQVSTKTLEPTPRWVGGIIRDICAEKGVVDLDLDEIPLDLVSHGVVFTRQSSARVAADYMRDNYRIDVTESGRFLKLVHRGKDPDAAWSVDELGASDGSSDPPPAISWQEADELGLPSQIVMKYSDRLASYEEGAVIAKRETAKSEQTKTLDATAMALTGEEAKKMVEQALADARIARHTFQVSTSYAKEAFEPTDVVTLPGAIRSRRGRLTKKTDRGAVIDWEGVQDDVGALMQYAVGGGGSPSSGISNNLAAGAPMSFAAILNLPSLREEDNDSGYYAFGVPLLVTTAYAGTQLQSTRASIGTLPKFGGLRGSVPLAVGAAAPGLFDEGNAIVVDVPSGFIPTSVTRDKVLGGANVYLLGAEIVGVCRWTPHPTVARRFVGRGLLRGVRGTEDEIATHAPNEQVLELSPRTLLRDLGYPAGATLDLSAVSLGRPLSDALNSKVSGTNEATALRPFSPIFFRRGATASGSLQFVAERRSRRVHASLLNFPEFDDGSQPGMRFEFATTPTFDITAAQIFGVSLPGRLFEYLATLEAEQGYLLQISGLTAGTTVYARAVEYAVAGTRGEPTAPLAFLMPTIATPPGLVSVSTAGPNSSSPTFTDTASGTPISVSGVTRSANRAVFNGSARLTLAPTREELWGFGIIRWVMEVSFSTSTTGGVQTLAYHGLPGFPPGSWRLTWEGSRLLLWIGDYSTTVPIITSSALSIADGAPHQIRITQLGGFFNAFGLTVDGVTVGSGTFRNDRAGQVVSGIVLGDDPDTSGRGLVGTLADFHIVTFSGNL